MKKTRYLVLAIVLFVIAIALGWTLVDAAPQTGNGSKSRTQMDQQTYNDTYGTEQVIILGQIATTPQTTNGSKSITQIAQERYNATYGANQVVLSTSTGKQVPFTNLTSVADGDFLTYESTSDSWVNIITIAKTVRVIAAATGTISINDEIVIVDYTTTGTVALTLPAASTAWDATTSKGKQFLIKDLDANAATNNITISRAGSDTIVDLAAAQTSTAITSNGGAIWIGAIAADTWIVY